MADITADTPSNPPPREKSFVVHLARDGRFFEVPAGETILDVLCANFVDVDYNCREGICGTCLVRVLEGEVDHRDAVMTEAERNSGLIAICCSRALTPVLVIDM
jgi:ferredoxin